MVENVDENYSSMDPNWSNKDKSDVQSPYAKPGEKLDKWSMLSSYGLTHIL